MDCSHRSQVSEAFNSHRNEDDAQFRRFEPAVPGTRGVQSGGCTPGTKSPAMKLIFSKRKRKYSRKENYSRRKELQ
jgi:hypothetical protein